MKYTIPIWAVQGDEQFPRLFGSGTLFAIADQRFLITTKHIVDATQFPPPYDCQLYTGDAPKGSPLIVLHGDVHSAKADGYDVSLWRLPREICQQLPDRKYLNLSHIDWSLTPLEKNAWYYLCGFPTAWGEKGIRDRKVKAKPICYGTTITRTEFDALENYDPRVHMLLDYSERNADTSGTEVGLPPWPGVSGCSIWRAWQQGELCDPLDVDRVKVVAVETCIYSKRRLIRGTRWRVALELLIRAFPKLRNPIELHTGRIRRT